MGNAITSRFRISSSARLCLKRLLLVAPPSLTKARNRATIPALLLRQNEQIQTKFERQTGKLSRRPFLTAHLVSWTGNGQVACRFCLTVNNRERPRQGAVYSLRKLLLV